MFLQNDWKRQMLLANWFYIKLTFFNKKRAFNDKKRVKADENTHFNWLSKILEEHINKKYCSLYKVHLPKFSSPKSLCIQKNFPLPKNFCIK